MSASINSTPSPAATALPIALNGAGAAEIANVAADSGVGSFGALFQQLLGKQSATAVDPAILATLTLSTDTDAAVAAEVNPVGTLAALMPFLEGLGLIKAEATDDVRDLENPASADTTEVDATALAGIAPALTPQLLPTAAITAVQPPAGNSTLASAPVPPEGEAILPLQMANLVAAGNADNRGSESAADSGLPAQAANLVAGSRTDGPGSAVAPEFATALEAATDKAAGVANTIHARNSAELPPTNPAVLTSQPIQQSNQPATALPALSIDQHVDAPGWGQEVGNRLVWMSNSTNSHAELVLTPPQMGRVEISLAVTGDQATATFISGNPAVREALEAAMPRLREVLADAGIQLGQTQVGAENARQSAQQEKNGDNFASNRDTAAARTSPMIAIPQPAASGLKIGQGLVDVFA